MVRPIHDTLRRSGRVASCVFLASLCALTGACSSNKQARDVNPEVEFTDSGLRGTVGAEVTIRRSEPTIVSGYGIVVGLDGSGGTDVPIRVAASLERELGLRGVGQPGVFQGTELEGLSPRQVLRHPDVAAVLVEAAVPLGAPEGMRFDVRVRALAGSSTTSLEGGVLWSTQLQAGAPSVVGGTQTRTVAVAHGPVFINPFLDPDSASTSVNLREGRLLGGGMMTEPLALELNLRNPLHSRARALTSAINQRFPDGPRGPGTVARGRSDETIQVEVPEEYHDRFGEFVELLLRTPIDPRFPEEMARRYTQDLRRSSENATELAWALRALGPPAIPFVRDLYEHEDPRIRMAALRAGAHLNDPRSTGPLEEIAVEEDGLRRIEAVSLLGVADGPASVDRTLRSLVAGDLPVDVRVRAYQSLAQRAERHRFRELMSWQSRRSPGQTQYSVSELDAWAGAEIPPGTPQGLTRRTVAGKFTFDLLPLGEPVIYVTLQREPRIAILGRGASLNRPLVASAWSDRLLIAADSENGDVRIRYDDRRNGRVVTEITGPDLATLVPLLGQTPSIEDPTDGFRMSYGQVVGALSAIQEAGGVQAAFTTENDILAANILEAIQEQIPDVRPEFGDDESAANDRPIEDETDPDRGALVVPIERDEKKRK